jgi:hypothetical protein
MSDKARAENKKRRDAEKAERKRQNVEKVQSTKKVTVWDRINAEKSGKVVETTDADGKVTKRVRTRKLSAKARQSHHRGHNPQRGNVCISTHDGYFKVKRDKAEELVAAGKADYATRSAWRKAVRDVNKKKTK